MKTNTIKESNVYESEGYLGTIKLSSRQLRENGVGSEWGMYDANASSNADVRWKTVVKLVYKDEHGVALLERTEYETGEEPDSKLTWVELR